MPLLKGIGNFILPSKTRSYPEEVAAVHAELRAQRQKEEADDAMLRALPALPAASFSHVRVADLPEFNSSDEASSHHGAPVHGSDSSYAGTQEEQGDVILVGLRRTVVRILMHNAHNEDPAGDPSSLGLVTTTRAAGRQKSYLGFHVAPQAESDYDIDRIATKLSSHSEDLFIVCELPDDNGFFTFMQKEKTNMKRIEGIPVSEFFTLAVIDKCIPAHIHNLVVLFEKMLNLGKRYVCNYKLGYKPMGQDVQDATEVMSTVSVSDVIKDFKKLSKDASMEEICEAKVKKAGNRTYRQHVVASCAMELKSLAGEDEVNAVTIMRRFAADDRIIELESIPNWNEIKVSTIDVSTGELIDFTLIQWLTEKAGFYSLVLLGASGAGKTPLAEALCSRLAIGLQDQDEIPYFIKAGTVDSLRKVKTVLKQFVPIMFDDITPGLRRGSRPNMTIDELKKTTTVYEADCTEARNNDIIIPANCPRIWTSNAMDPSEWHPDLSSFEDMLALSPAERLSRLSAHAVAVFKRCGFAIITGSIIPQDVVHNYRRSSSNEFANKMRRVV